MGGNALKHTITERKTTEEFNRIANEIIRILKKELRTDIHIVECYRKKQTHGDMDVLIKIDHDLHNRNINLVNFIKEYFSPNEIYNNNGVISFDVDQFQIDFIPVKESHWEGTKVWTSFDPTGNLMGKIAHKFGLKYAPEGLLYPFRNFNGRLSQNIFISDDNYKIFEFLGFDYNRYLKGFDTLEEIFDYVINSKYFDSEMFDLKNLNQKDRKRNRKRKTYNQFIEYIKVNNINKKYEFKHKDEYIVDIDKFFTESKLIQKLKELKIKDSINQESNKKFNGRLVMEKYPDLKGKELGNLMSNFMKSFDNFKEYTINHTSEQIMEQFDEFYYYGYRKGD
jgi:hypothetical protein